MDCNFPDKPPNGQAPPHAPPPLSLYRPHRHQDPGAAYRSLQSMYALQKERRRDVLNPCLATAPVNATNHNKILVADGPLALQRARCSGVYEFRGPRYSEVQGSKLYPAKHTTGRLAYVFAGGERPCTCRQRRSLHQTIDQDRIKALISWLTCTLTWLWKECPSTGR